MKKVAEEQYEINILMWLFSNYTLFILFNDYITYFLKGKEFINYILSIIIICLINYFIRKKIKLVRENINKYDVCSIIIFVVLYIIRIAVPDSSYDVLNYHLYVQENPFANNINYNYFPGRWINTFSFPLADRMIYFFRYILNYRLGVIFNLLILVLIYFQTKRLLKIINIFKKEKIISIISFLIIVTEQILCNSITYYTDIIGIPIFLEIIILCLKKTKKPAHNYILFLAGILLSLKISNAFFIVILGIWYICIYKKTINIKTIFKGALIFILPWLVYLINNYCQTGNPFFPFYNAIFKSPYLDNVNWIETFYGPKTLIELIIWPIYILFNPRRAYDTNIYYGRISIAYTVCIILLVITFIKIIQNIKKKKNIKEFILRNYNTLVINLLYFIMCIVWGKYMMGYIRYALILEIIGGIVILLFINHMLKKQSFFSDIAIILIVIACSFQIVYSLRDAFYSNIELSWRYPITNKLGYDKYKNNIKSLFEKTSKNEESLNFVDCIGIVDFNSGYASMITDKIPIISLNASYTNDYSYNEYKKVLKKCNNIFTITTKYTRDRTQAYLNEINYRLTDKVIVLNNDFLDEENELYLIEIKSNLGEVK